jgi:hypothetical protein
MMMMISVYSHLAAAPYRARAGRKLKQGNNGSLRVIGLFVWISSEEIIKARK